jgi:hypothetical protein
MRRKTSIFAASKCKKEKDELDNCHSRDYRDDHCLYGDDLDTAGKKARVVDSRLSTGYSGRIL